MEEAFSYYVEESAARLQRAVAKTIESGKGFNEVLTHVSSIGRTRTLRVTGLGERDAETGHVTTLVGAVQDISELAEAQEANRRLEKTAEMVGRVARVGGWKLTLDPLEVYWSPETALLHDEPPGTQPDLENAINYYTEEFRPKVGAAVAACTEQGKPFDELWQIVTAKGRPCWVRSIGEAVRNEDGKIVAIQGAFQDVSELIRMQRSADELSHRLHQTLNNISDAFVLLDSEWRFTFVNAQCQRLLRRDVRELLGKKPADVYPEYTGSKFQVELERAVKDGKSVHFEANLNALEQWLEVDAHPTADGLAIYFRDVTRQKAQREQLRLLEAAVGHQGDILLITEANSIDEPGGPLIVYVNEAFERRTGYTYEEVVGKETPRILQGPATDRVRLDEIRYALSRGQQIRTELINYSKSGEEYWVELDIVPLADEAGKITHWVAVERDITERKKNDQVIELSEERFRLIARATRTAVWETNIIDNTQWWSDGLTEIFGHKLDVTETVPSAWRANIHPADLPRVERRPKNWRWGKRISSMNSTASDAQMTLGQMSKTVRSYYGIPTANLHGSLEV